MDIEVFVPQRQLVIEVGFAGFGYTISRLRHVNLRRPSNVTGTECSVSYRFYSNLSRTREDISNTLRQVDSHLRVRSNGIHCINNLSLGKSRSAECTFILLNVAIDMHLEEVFKCILDSRLSLLNSERFTIPVLVIFFASDRLALNTSSGHLSNLTLRCHVLRVFEYAYDIIHLTIFERHTGISHEGCSHIVRHIIIGLLGSCKQELQRQTINTVTFKVNSNFVVLVVNIVGHIHYATLQAFPHFERLTLGAFSIHEAVHRVLADHDDLVRRKHRLRNELICFLLDFHHRLIELLLSGGEILGIFLADVTTSLMELSVISFTLAPVFTVVSTLFEHEALVSGAGFTNKVIDGLFDSRPDIQGFSSCTHLGVSDNIVDCLQNIVTSISNGVEPTRGERDVLICTASHFLNGNLSTFLPTNRDSYAFLTINTGEHFFERKFGVLLIFNEQITQNLGNILDCRGHVDRVGNFTICNSLINIINSCGKTVQSITNGVQFLRNGVTLARIDGLFQRFVHFSYEQKRVVQVSDDCIFRLVIRNSSFEFVNLHLRRFHNSLRSGLLVVICKTALQNIQSLDFILQEFGQDILLIGKVSANRLVLTLCLHIFQIHLVDKSSGKNFTGNL